MKQLFLSLAMGLASLILLAPAIAWAGPGGRAGWGHHNDFYHQPHRDRGWHNGRWEHVWHKGRYGWWWVVGPSWYWYPAVVHPYPIPEVEVVPVPAPVLQLQAAPVVVTPGAQASARNQPLVWYYCDSAGAYYPYVNQCLNGWRTVPVGSGGAQPEQVDRY